MRILYGILTIKKIAAQLIHIQTTKIYVQEKRESINIGMESLEVSPQVQD